ncbi:ATP-binding cassette domain-containing protein [Luteolibacter sp. SL250]|uniref:ATP-binding cassette domain-containing protein n=1 Tax=Luteolibacter sp. SL250 TaxID=2995170 RepID=UPI00226F2E50|nr:ATP-binding cassette domain-containing protein [Luteolibacter sp. SL250]WAC20749.1 ATP-binding cassette domain-containing protein [Luteolibacter sp. SL250]
MPEVVVSFRGVTKTFKGMEGSALDDVSGEIRTGVITGLAGPDGAGKTTLLRLIAGLLEADKGGISTLGHDPVEEAAAIRTAVGYMPQKFGLYEDLTVIENLTLHADLRDVIGEERKETFDRLLEFTDLKRFTDRFAGKLSGGMKQKLGLACALLGKPKLLLLDEPGVGVDPISRKELWGMVEDLVEQGIAVVWSTAYLDEAELCGTTIVLNEGKVLFTGTPAEMTAPLEKRVFHLKNLAEGKRRLLTRALARPEVTDGSIQGHNLRLTLKKGARAFPPDEITAGGGAEWAEVAPRFEDAFIDMLGGGPEGESVLAKHMPEIPDDGAVVIEADSLTKKFGDFAATDQVSFKVKRGEIYGLLGPNGAGKSTTFKMMCGLLVPTAGRASVVGLDLRHSAGEARQKLGYMAQKFSLYGGLTVAQNLEFFSGIYGLNGRRRKDKCRDMADIFHLGPFLKSKTDSLSLGYKQRLALACSVMHEPDILFLDEPTSGVDPVTRREFWTHINGLVERGVTVMVTTHFMDEAEYCDRIGLVFRGQLIANGTPDELKEMVATQDNPDPTMEDAFIGLVTGKEEA